MRLDATFKLSQDHAGPYRQGVRAGRAPRAQVEGLAPAAQMRDVVSAAG